MNMKRRSFLKGLLGIAAVAAVGLPPVADETLFDEIEQFLDASGERGRPTGPYGSVRIDSRWYALYDASVDVQQNFLEYTDGLYMHRIPTTKEWSVAFELDNIDGIDLFGRAPHDIEFGLHNKLFSGQGYLTGMGSSIDARGVVRYDLRLDGIGQLTLG